MATKSMGYDNPTYVAVGEDQLGAIAATAAAPSATKCVAFTNMILKAAILRITASPTAADVPAVVQISGTTTTTTALGTVGSGATGFSYLPLATSLVLSQGDEYYVQKGTDTSATYLACVERVVQPLANVTV